MTTTEFITATYLRSTGKATPPAAGTSKYNRILDLGNFFIDEWANQLGVDWASLYDPAVSLGTVTATDSFDIDTSTIRKLSDREGDTVRIVWSNGVGYTDYDLVSADTLKDHSYGVSKQSPLGSYATRIGGQLVFNHTFTSSDSQFGGEIFVPAYVFPDKLVSDDDEVPVDIPNWLVARTAAEFCRNDITRRSRYPELLTEANEILQRMKDDQEGQIVMVNRPWSTPGGIGTDSAWS